MASEHIVRAYDDQLKRLKAEISEMGGLVEAQLGQAIQAVHTRDGELGQRCVASDAKVDALEREIDESVVKMLALRQPMAGDLRTILSALKIAADLERIGDYAANVGKRVQALVQFPPVPSVSGVVRLGQLARLVVKDVLDAFAASDTAGAIRVNGGRATVRRSKLINNTSAVDGGALFDLSSGGVAPLGLGVTGHRLQARPQGDAIVLTDLDEGVHHIIAPGQGGLLSSISVEAIDDAVAAP